MTASVIGALRVNLSADTAEFKRNLTDAERAAERFGRAIGSKLRAGLVGLTAAAGAGAVALGALIKSSFDTIGAQVDLAKRVGASVGAIQTLEHAAKLAGASQEALAKTIGTLNTRLGEAAREGAGPAYEALQRLGLSARELSQMDADERIKALSDRMVELGYSTQQQADTLRDLGVRQQEIINLFQEGSAAIDEARAELAAWGVLLSDVDAAKVEAAGDAWDKIGTVLQGVGNQIAIRVAPLVQALAENVGDAAKETGGFGDAIDKALSFGIRLWAGLNREIYDFRISVDEGMAALLDGFDWLAKQPAGLLATIFGGTAEDYGWKPVNESFGKLKENLARPPSDEEWDAWFEEKRNQADALAEAVAASTRAATGTGDEDTEADQRAQDRLNDQLTRRLEALQESLLTEREAEMLSYEQRLADLQEFYEKGKVTAEQAADLRVRIEKDHADKIKAIDDDILRNQQRNAQMQQRALFDIADNVGSAFEAIFGESKALAIAQALINTAQAVTRTLAEYGATPLGLAAAAAAAAAGAAQIATIRGTSRSGGGGGGGRAALPSSVPSGGGSSPQQSPQAGLDQTLFIRGLAPGDLYSGEAVRDLAAKLIEFQRDGGKVVLAPT